MALPPDLITPAYAQGFLADLDLTSNQQAALPALVTAASAAVRAYCRRVFSLWTFDELYTLASPDRDVLLRQSPLVEVDRCASGLTPVVSVWNSDTTTNQRATALLAATGDMLTGFAVSGLTLNRWASGTNLAVSVPFTAGMTAEGLEAAILALGNGWNAETGDGLDNWPVADLRPPQGAWPAYGATTADFSVHVNDLAFTPDERSGRLYLESGGGVDSQRWGPGFSGEVNEAGSYGGALGLRVVYQAGFVTVPADVQQFTAETVKSALERFQTDSTLQSESDGVLSWAARPDVAQLPRSAQVRLFKWVNARA